MRVSKGASAGKEWTIAFPADFVSHWYNYLQISKIFTTILDSIHSPSQTHFIFLKKFVNKTLIYVWLVKILTPYLQTFHWTKPLICIDSLYKDDENSPNIHKDVFRNLLTLATKESFFMLNNKF